MLWRSPAISDVIAVITMFDIGGSAVIMLKRRLSYVVWKARAFVACDVELRRDWQLLSWPFSRVVGAMSGAHILH